MPVLEFREDVWTNRTGEDLLDAVGQFSCSLNPVVAGDVAELVAAERVELPDVAPPLGGGFPCVGHSGLERRWFAAGH